MPLPSTSIGRLRSLLPSFTLRCLKTTSLLTRKNPSSFMDSLLRRFKPGTSTMIFLIVVFFCVMTPPPRLSPKDPLSMLGFSPAIRSAIGQLETPLGEVSTNLFRVSTIGEVRPRRLNFELVYKINSLFPVVFSAQTVWVTSDSIREFVIPYKPYMAGGPWDLRVKILETNRRSYSDCTIDLSRGDLVIVDSLTATSVEAIPQWTKEYPSSYAGGDGSTRSIVPARVGRRGGIIHSDLKNPVYIGFGAVPTENPNSVLLKGSRIEIPVGFEGAIFCNFKGQQSPSASNPGPLVSVIEYGKE